MAPMVFVYAVDSDVGPLPQTTVARRLSAAAPTSFPSRGRECTIGTPIQARTEGIPWERFWVSA